MNKINIAHVMGCIDPQTGGPSNAVKNLCMQLPSYGFNPHIFSFHYPYDDRNVVWDGLRMHQLNYSAVSSHLAGWNPRGFREFLHLISRNQIQLIHNQGLWLFVNRYARQAAQKHRIPLFTSVRGMLEAWTLKQNVLKKNIAWHLYERKNLEYAAAFHATSQQEAESIRRAGFKQPIAVIPNGISPAAFHADMNCPHKKQLLFLSRIDSKKGLERLFSIWERRFLQFPDWELIVAGDNAPRYAARLKAEASKKQMSRSIRWVGFVQEEAKVKIFEQASLFILPTFSENFGNVVGEALMHGVPVITTEGTPWHDIQSARCGWYTKNNEEAIEKALVEALNASAQTLKEMGARGKALIQTKYTWPEAAQKMVDTYRWILKMAEKPDCIRMN